MGLPDLIRSCRRVLRKGRCSTSTVHSNGDLGNGLFAAFREGLQALSQRRVP